MRSSEKCLFEWLPLSCRRETWTTLRAREGDFFTVVSTVREIFAAKLRNSTKCSANRIRSVYL